MNQETIYKVQQSGVGRDHLATFTIAYATGNPEDILASYKGKFPPVTLREIPVQRHGPQPEVYNNPPTAVDLIIECYQDKNYKKPLGIVLIDRLNPPYQHLPALPGGFQEDGDSLETTAIKEAKEETGLDIKIMFQLPVFSDPHRDPRKHINSVGFYAKAVGIPVAGDDAKNAYLCPLKKIPKELAFDHRKRIDYLLYELHADASGVLWW